MACGNFRCQNFYFKRFLDQMKTWEILMFCCRIWKPFEKLKKKKIKKSLSKVRKLKYFLLNSEIYYDVGYRQRIPEFECQNSAKTLCVLEAKKERFLSLLRILEWENLFSSMGVVAYVYLHVCIPEHLFIEKWCHA